MNYNEIVMIEVKEKHLLRLSGLLVAGSLCLLVFLLVFGSPTQLILPLLVLPYILLFVFGYSLQQLIFIVRTKKGPTKRNIIRFAVVALVPVLLVVLQSLGQLSPKDFIIALSFLLLSAYYLNRADFL